MSEANGDSGRKVREKTLAEMTVEERIGMVCCSVSDEKGHTFKKWDRIHAWVKRHRHAIDAYGFADAAHVAQKRPSRVCNRDRKNGWRPLRGVCPTEQNLRDSFWMQYWRK